MILFTPKTLIFLFIQVSLVLTIVKAVCDSNCNLCDEAASTCVSCNAGYRLGLGSCDPCLENQYSIVGENSCSPCPMGTYSFAGSAQCITCSPGTYSIMGTLYCTTCPAGQYYYGPDCRNCQGGSIPDPLASYCQACPAGKFAVSGYSECLSCSIGMFSMEGQSSCVSTCPAGYRQISSLRACERCAVGMWAIAGDASCRYCPDGSVPNADQSACVECGTGLWAGRLDSMCESCGDNCESCASKTKCQTCQYPMKSVNGKCMIVCPQGQFIDPFGECEDCPANCLKCKSTSTCSVCKTGYIYQMDLETGVYGCSRKPKNPEKEATQSSAATLEATSTVAKTVSSGSSGALGFGVVAKVIRNARYFGIKYSNKTEGIFAAGEGGGSSFGMNPPKSFEKIGSKQLQGNFGRYAVEPNFLINYWGNLIPILILCGCFVMLKVVKRYVSQSKKRKLVTNKIVKLFQISAGNYLVNSLYGSFDEIVLYFILEAQTCTFDSAFSWISFLCALVFLAIGLGFFGFHFYILRKYQAAKGIAEKENKERLEDFKAKHAYVKILFEDFKDDSLIQQSFLASFMIRASLLNVLLCVFVEKPLTQACLYLVINLLFLIFLVVKRPYEQFKGAAAQYFGEVIVQITYTCALVLALLDHNGSDAKNLRELLEKTIIFLGIGLNVGGTVFQILDILIGAIAHVKSWKIWRARLKIARAPAGAVSKAMMGGNHVDMTFMKVKKLNTGLASLKVSPRPMKKEENINDSPTRLIPSSLDTEMERLDLPSTTSTRKPSTIIFTGESQSDLDYQRRTGVFEIDGLREIRIDMDDTKARIGERNMKDDGPAILVRRASTKIFTGESQNDLDYRRRTELFEVDRSSEMKDRVNEEGEVFGDLVVYHYEKKLDIFETTPPVITNEIKGEEKEKRNNLVSVSDQPEQQGEACGDLIVFDYEKVQKIKEKRVLREAKSIWKP